MLGDVTEADLALALGIARADLKNLRAGLEHGAHWLGGDGKPVMITSAGVTRLREMLEKNGAGDAAAVESGAAYETLLAVKIGSARVLLAREMTDKELGASFDQLRAALAESARAPVPGKEPYLIRVQVRSSANFMPGMRLERCMRDLHQRDVAFYHGRYPRRKGRF